jgi:hypothetical protein
MPLVTRILAVVLAFIAACVAAAVVITLGVVLDWEQLLSMPGFGIPRLVLAFSLFLSRTGLLPAFLLIACAEGLRIRSILFYAAAGGLGLVGLYYGAGLGEHSGGIPLRREMEIMAGAGIVGGFVYWALAGRVAGAWRGEPAP